MITGIGTEFIEKKRIEKVFKKYGNRFLNKILSETTNQSIKKIQADTERDYFMNAQEAVKYGLVDEILKNRK